MQLAVIKPRLGGVTSSDIFPLTDLSEVVRKFTRNWRGWQAPGVFQQDFCKIAGLIIGRCPTPSLF